MEPSARPKGAGLAFIPSTYARHDGREHKAQRERGSFVTLTGDVDKGDHALEHIKALTRSFAGDAAWLIYSSAHARPGDMRWRIVIPLASPLPFAIWHDAQNAFFGHMEAGGVPMDRALARAAQPVYLPNVPPVHAKSGEPLRAADGSALYYRCASSNSDTAGLSIKTGPVAAGIASIRHQREQDDRERERLRREAEKSRTNRPADQGSIIEGFNATNGVAAMLQACGYEQSPRKGEDWRSPHQTGETYATRVIGDKWVSLSASDAAAGLGAACGSVCYGDAYDLYVHYKHGGDHRAAYRELGREQREARGRARHRARDLSNPTPNPGDPGWQEMPRRCGGEGGPTDNDGGSDRPTTSMRERRAEASWAAPDMSVLSGGRGKPAPMPGDLFGSLWSLVGDLADGAGAPVDYVALSVLAVAASLIGAKRRVQPFATSPTWREPCILWVAAVGDPSANKSPAIDAGTFPLAGMEAEHAEAHRHRLSDYEAVLERAKAERAQWQSDVKAAAKEGASTPSLPAAAELPEPPERVRLKVQDATPEAMGAILAGNPNGTLHLRDELAGWLMSFERYSPGGREFWLEAYGGRPHVIDRKGAGKPLPIPFNGVSVLGGIQPAKLAECMLESPDDGLVPRFLWAWPDPVHYHRPRAVADAQRLERVYRRLGDLLPGEGGVPVVLMLSPAAADMFEAWIQDGQSPSDAASLYKSFCGKLRGTALRLALVAELLAWAADGGPEPTRVSERSITAALTFLEDYAKPTALRVFGDAALPVVERNAAMLGRYIQRTNARTINARDVQRESGIPTLKIAADVEAATQALVEADWLRPAPSRSGGTTGRARKDFEVNPAVHHG